MSSTRRRPVLPVPAAGPAPDRHRAGSGADPVKDGLEEVARRLRSEGLYVPTLRGKLLRPRWAHGVLPESLTGPPPAAFWSGALAIQMVHDASLLHDDILDGSSRRRGRETTAVQDGVGTALVAGDRLLTSSYRAAARTGSERFLHEFVDAVDRTVQGEERQGRSSGRVLGLDEYREIVAAKSGALFGAAFVLGPCLADGGRANGAIERARRMGVRVGTFYQMVDDLLDYCPALDRGKPALGDFRQRKWTFPLLFVGALPFERSEEEILGLVVGGGRGASPLRTAMALLEDVGEELADDLTTGLPERPRLGDEIRGWLERAREGVAAEEAAGTRTPARSASLDLESGSAGRDPARARIDAMARDLGGPKEWEDVLSRHSRSFHFASRFFPSALRWRIAGVYTFCRFTDDLVDESPELDAGMRRRLLEAWRKRVRAAYWSGPVGIPLLDEVVGGAARAGVRLGYIDGLLQGVSEDLEPTEYSDLEALRGYTFRVASVVGGWITELLGVRNPAVLDRAFALGHAMQLTNIVRDVGEDARAGRLYLPLDRMTAHGVRRRDVEAAAHGLAPPPPGFARLAEELLRTSEAEYRRAFEGIAALPASARAPVAAAARIYRGIHREIRRNGHDTLTRRAFTSLPRKAWLAGEAAGALAVSELLRRLRSGRARGVESTRRTMRSHPSLDGRIHLEVGA